MPNPLYTFILDIYDFVCLGFMANQDSFVCTQLNSFKYCYVILIIQLSFVCPVK